MNSRQLQYTLMLAKDRSFSQVAAKLKITQPALSKYIINLEKELGVRLFDRSVTPLELTPAGERFVQEAQLLLFRQERLLRDLEEYKNGEAGRLIICMSPFRSVYLMPRIVKLIRERYPDIEVVLSERVGNELQQYTADWRCDFALMNLPVDEALFDYTELKPEKVLLVVPDDLLRRYGMAIPSKDQSSYSEMNLAACSELPFVMLGKEQELPLLFSRLCEQAGIQPNICVEVETVTTAWAMAKAGVGATVLPTHFIHGVRLEGISLFALRQTGYECRPAIVYRKGQYLSKAALYAIELLKNRLA